MPAFNASSTIVNLLLAGAFALLYGCASKPDSPQNRAKFTGNPHLGRSTLVTPASDTPGTVGGGEPVSTVIDARPAALVNGRPVNWGELRPILSELGGVEALQELMLDRKLGEALVDANIAITPDDVARERKLLLESLNDNPDVAIRLLDELRDRQHLGKFRFDALMQRNAALRALVQKDVKLNEAAIEVMHDIVHGPKRQARIMILRDLQSAQAAINLVNSGATFADVAVEMSTDSSAARGGLLEPMSQSDPAYPQPLRHTLWTLDPGQLSGPVLLDDRYAVVMLVKRMAGDSVSLEDARPSLQRMVRINQERLLMDQLARRLMADTAVTVFDHELNDMWQRLKRNSSPAGVGASVIR